MKRWLFVCAAACASLGAAALAGCNGVLGIDEASLDPTLTDGGAEGGAEGGAGDAGGDTGNQPVTCDTYCSTIMANCMGINQEYIDIDTCKVMCSHFEPGVPDDTTMDSLACRNYHAHAAAGDPNFHCRHAGPLGGFHCGTDPCVPYCSLVQALCGSMAMPPFPGEIQCQNACRPGADGGGFNYLVGDAGDINLTMGDTLNCRIYHLESAYEPNNPAAATTHCPHTAVVSATCH